MILIFMQGHSVKGPTRQRPFRAYYTSFNVRGGQLRGQTIQALFGLVMVLVSV